VASVQDSGLADAEILISSMLDQSLHAASQTD
jgi:hypothetical protein